MLDLASAQAAVIASPDDAKAWLQLGSAHYVLAGAGSNHYLEAHLAFERSLNMKGMAPAALGLASTTYTFGQYDLALRLAQLAQQAGPYREAELAEGGILLKMGQWEEGWNKHEARLRRPDSRTPPYTGTLADLKGKTVFVRGEQGYGDNIQFSRYVHKLAPYCGNVVVEAPDGMLTLLIRMLQPVASVIEKTDAMLGDFQISVMSLPLLLGPMHGWEPIKPKLFSIPAGADAAGGIGICRASTVDCPTSLRKNPPSEVIEAIVFDIKRPHSLMPAHFEPVDWLDTAQRMAKSCNLVISVDTAVAHLAATMGIETWLLQRFDSCWRWDHPNWYPGVRIFQQPSPGEWGSVVDEVRAALTARG